jgi:lysozyme
MTLNGIDVSGFQPANITALVNYDFVFIKATEGTGYTSSEANAQYQAAVARGHGVGVYHFADTGDATAQANYFVQHIGGYVGKAMLALDWEGNAVAQGPGWAKTFLDRVYALTGVRPVIYMSASVIDEYDWTAVRAGDYGLWMASYGANQIREGYSAPAAPGVKFWGSPILYQYGSQERLPGYASNLDVDAFYGDAKAWAAFAAKNGKAVLPPAVTSTPTASTSGKNITTRPTAQVQKLVGVTADGIYGPATTAAVRKWQSAHGLTPDGIWGPQSDAKGFPAKAPGVAGTPQIAVDGNWGPATTTRIQEVLKVSPVDGKLGPITYEAMQRRLGVSADGIWGPQSKEALQKHLGVAADGIVGPLTVEALQRKLNANSF